MGTINHGYINRVKYVLQCEQLNDEITIIEPIGWNSDDKELARNSDYDGIVAKFSNSLKFIGDGADFIELAHELYDVIAKIKLTKYELHPKTDREIKTYWGYLDLMTKEWEDGKLSIKFNSGGLQEDIKSRESENVEIDRTTTIDGKLIDPIAENEVLFQGRRIFLKSLWEAKNPDESLYLQVESKDGNTRAQTAGYPIAVVSSSQEQVQSILSGSLASENTGTTGMMFMTNFDRHREINVVGSGLSFKPDIVWAEWDWAFLKVCLTVYKTSDYLLKSRTDLKVINTGELWNNHKKTVTVQDFNIPLIVEQGDSIALEFFIKSDLKNYVGSTQNARFAVNITEIKGALAAEEDSYFDSSTAKFYLAHEVLNQLTTIAANTKKAFYSDYFGRTDLGYAVNGPGAFIGTAHGFAVRGFNKLPIPNPDLKIENLYKPMTTSLKDAIESMKSVFNVGVGIEEINGKERLRIEEKSYFYNNNVTIKLPNQVKKVKRSVASDYYFPSIEIGFEKGGDYEEAQGLDEPNGKSNFTTLINKGKNVFTQLSKYRADSYGKEFARRKPFATYGTEDTQYDSDVFLLDLKQGNNGLFEERKWQDDFAKAPTGIFSPDTANGLRFSPFNMLLRHGWFIASGLTKYAVEKVRYGSSTANSQLKTQLIGGNEYAENGNIINSELQKARFVPEWIEFEHECSFEIMQMVQGTTIIQGKKIQNFYGTVEFINERNQIEKGFLFNLKPNGKGSWKILKANR